jgi:plasmid stability protein
VTLCQYSIHWRRIIPPGQRWGWIKEAEHREILRQALLPAEKRKPFKDLLLAMPQVGDDADFERASDRGRDVEL